MARPQDEKKRTRIIEAALQTFGEVGFAEATIKEIAARADLAPGSIYTYFEDKRALFRSTTEHAWSQLHQAIDRIRSGSGSYLDKLAALRNEGFRVLKTIHPILNGAFTEAVRMDVFNENLERFLDQLEALYLDSKERGEIHELEDHQDRRFLLRTIACGLLLQLSIVDEEHLDEEIDRLQEALRRNEVNWIALNRELGTVRENRTPNSRLKDKQIRQ